jgi:hypothetical protein
MLDRLRFGEVDGSGLDRRPSLDLGSGTGTGTGGR